MHYWPASRPIAVCSAVTIATLLPDPADAPEKMKIGICTNFPGHHLSEKQREYLCDLITSLTRWSTENGHGDWDAERPEGTLGE